MPVSHHSTSQPTSAYAEISGPRSNGDITLTFCLRHNKQAVVVMCPFRTTRCGGLWESRFMIKLGA
jgi:hypothetical protein